MNQWEANWSWMKGHAAWLVGTKDHRQLTMVHEDFNDSEQFKDWVNQGFSPRTGHLYDMRYANQQPPLTKKLIDYVSKQGFEHIGVSYYRMDPGDNLPYHSDLYVKYVSLFKLESRKQDIVRFVFFPEDRGRGQIFEVDGKLIDWKAGDWVAWKYDTPHMAANLGPSFRYSIQVTGVLCADIKSQ